MPLVGIITRSLIIQGDQKVSVHLMMYCNHQFHIDFLITLYENTWNGILQNTSIL